MNDNTFEWALKAGATSGKNYYDLNCPGCGCWGGKHKAWRGRDTCSICRANGGVCNFVVTDSLVTDPIGKSLYGSAHQFGKWGYTIDGGKTIQNPQIPLITTETVEFSNHGQCECGAWATGAALKSSVHSTWCPEFSMLKPVEMSEVEKCKAHKIIKYTISAAQFAKAINAGLNSAMKGKP